MLLSIVLSDEKINNLFISGEKSLMMGYTALLWCQHRKNSNQCQVGISAVR